LDNFSWGNPDKPDQLGALVRAAKACYDISVAYGTPFISGKDSLNNEYRDTSIGEQLSIPPTLLISALCVIEDISMAVSMDLKAAEDLVYILGKTYNELGGSHYYSLFKHVGKNVPKVRPDESKKNMDALSQAIHHPKLRMIRACHDCSEGGIGAAAAEMAFSGELGLKIDLRNIPKSEDIIRNDMALFSESNSRFIVEVPKEVKTEFEIFMESKGADFALLGKVTGDERFEVIGLDENVVVSAPIHDLKEAWQKTLRW
jgi:phosphoribosylformylglycinamidine synthase